MKSLISATCFLIAFFVVYEANAQTDDGNIIIENRIETYSYKTSSGSNVILEGRSDTDYKCLKWPETIPIGELYSDYVQVENVSIKAAKKITPVYEMYRQDGIFYSDTKICYFNLPFSKKGETATVSFEKIYNDIRLFTTISLFESYYVRRKTVKILIPSWMQVDIMEYNIGDNIEKSEIKDTKTGTICRIYTVKDQRAHIWSVDAPGYYKTAPYLIIVPRSASLKKEEITFFKDYDDVYKWCKDKVDMVVNDEEYLNSFTQQIIAESLNEDDKISKIFAWVQDNIRYTAFLHGLAGWVPDNAQDVLRKKYGDCKGMSNLLKTMLRSAGFDARLVWVPTRAMYSHPEIPLPMFDHMICALVKGDEIIYLDPTVKYIPRGEYHESIQGRMTLIEDGGKYIRGEVPLLPTSRNTDSLHCYYRIDGNTLAGEVSMLLSGQTKQNILSQIYALESSRRINELKQFLEKNRPQNKVLDISIGSNDLNTRLLSITYNEIRSGCVNRVGKEIYVDMDSRKDLLMATVDTLKRKTDIEFRCRELTIREESLELPEGYEVVSLPDSLYVENNNLRINITYEITGGNVNYRKEIEIKDTWLKKQDFDKWNNDISKLTKSYQTQVVLRKMKSP